jgi:dipeptidyl aminopeptidase/acylaminoacyl peptidase
MIHRLEGEVVDIAGPDQARLAATVARPQGKMPGKGWPVVAAFHGLTLNRHFFYDLAAPLNGQGIALLAVDFRGHGDSGGNLVDTTLQGQCQDVGALLRALPEIPQLNPQKTGFIGFSMGAVPLLQALKQSAAPLALWAPLLNTVEWCQRRLAGFERVPPDLVRIWNGQLVGAGLFVRAQEFEPKNIAEYWPGPLLVAHALKDKNQRPSESQSLARRRLAMDRPVQAWFPPLSGHLFALPDERAGLLARSCAFFKEHLAS